MTPLSFAHLLARLIVGIFARAVFPGKVSAGNNPF